jgi:hypothetical protein
MLRELDDEGRRSATLGIVRALAMGGHSNAVTERIWSTCGQGADRTRQDLSALL